MGIFDIPPETHHRQKKIYFLKNDGGEDFYLINKLFRFFIICSIGYGGMIFFFSVLGHAEFLKYLSYSKSGSGMYYWFTFYLNLFSIFTVFSLFKFYKSYSNNEKIKELNILRILGEKNLSLLSVSLFNRFFWVAVFIYLALSSLVPSFTLFAILTSRPFYALFLEYNNTIIFVFFSYLLWCFVYPIVVTASFTIGLGILSYRTQHKDKNNDNL